MVDAPIEARPAERLARGRHADPPRKKLTGWSAAPLDPRGVATPKNFIQGESAEGRWRTRKKQTGSKGAALDPTRRNPKSFIQGGSPASRWRANTKKRWHIYQAGAAVFYIKRRTLH